MENLFQSTHKIQQILQSEKIPSIVIGGLALAVWGEPRLTRDADLKVLIQRDQSKMLIDLLKPYGTFLSTEDPEKTIKKVGFIFFKDSFGVRIDLLLAETSFDAQAIQRGNLIEIQPNLPLIFCTPEDLILYKMISTRLRDREDVHSIILRQKSNLDEKYLLFWLKEFEQALDDSTLIEEYRKMKKSKI